jgi:nucleotide-binding universal stress UspA family protein
MHSSITKILVATDGTSASREAVDLGVELAASENAEVVFLHVAQPVEYRYVRGARFRAIPRQLDSDGDSALEEATEVASKRGVEHQLAHFAGETPDLIVNVAEAVDADLIVVGSRGRRLSYKSVSRHVVKHADRPVLIAPQKDKLAA